MAICRKAFLMEPSVRLLIMLNLHHCIIKKMKFQRIRLSFILITLIFLLLYSSMPAVITRLSYELEGPFTWDTPMYWAVGRALLEGEILYLEMFENKPPIIFILSAISYSLTNDYYLLNYFSFVIHIFMIFLPILIGIKVKLSLPMILMTTSLGIFVSLYSFMNSAYVQIEAFGAFFSLIYLSFVYLNRNKRSVIIVLFEGFFLMVATLTKEPFYLVIFAISLVMFKDVKEWIYHFLFPSIVGGILGLLLLLSINSFSSYFLIYLPHMFGEHVDYYGSPFLRGFNILRIFQDLEFHLNNLLSLFLITSLIAVLTHYFVRAKNLVFNHGKQINLFLRYTFAIYLVSFVVGLGGQYYNHHFIFALPFFVGLGLELSIKLSNSFKDYFEKLTAKILIIFFSLGISINYLTLPPFNESLPLIQLQKNLRIHATFIDDLMRVYQLNSYQFIGFNGPQFYGHTKKLPEGPVFFQDPRNFNRLDSWFVEQFIFQLENVDAIVVHSVNLGVIQDYFFDYKESNFFEIDDDALLLVNLVRPSSFNDTIYIRKNLE